jgi:tRNA (cytidine/uridine-2'-O-)-methyltransferase
LFNIVLVHPQIPQNTGSIGRICVNTNTKLHIIKPIGFDITEKAVRRAGLDYWKLLNLRVWDTLDDFYEANKDYKERFFYATTKTKIPYFKKDFKKGDFLFFGSETKGIPLKFMKKNWKNSMTIPMCKNGRSLNLSVSVGIILYEAIKQNFTEFDMV